MKKAVVKTVIFFCSLAVLLFSLVWLAYEINDYFKYQKVTAQVTSVSDKGYLHHIVHNEYGLLREYEVELAYTIDGKEYTKSFMIDETETDKYCVGAGLVYYHRNGWTNGVILPEATVKGIMREMILCPVSLVIPAFIFMLYGLTEAKRFDETARRFKKPFIFSAAGCAAITVYTVIKLFVQTPVHYDFVFINSEYLFVIDCIFYSVIFIIAEIIIWKKAVCRANTDGGVRSKWNIRRITLLFTKHLTDTTKRE